MLSTMTALGSKNIAGNISENAGASLWHSSMDLTFDTTSAKANVAGNVINPVIRVSLNAKTIPDDTQRANIFNSSNQSGAAILFVDADTVTMLPHEVSIWNDGEQQAILWVKVPLVTGNSSTDKIIMRYGLNNFGWVQPNYPAGATTNVWSDFNMVQHFEGATVVDSTVNAYDGTLSGSPTSLRGRIGLGRHLDASDDLITYPASASIKGKTQIYCSAWVRVVKAENKICDIFNDVDSISNNNRFQFYLDGNPKKIKVDGRDADGGTLRSATGATTLTADGSIWYYVGGAWNSVGDTITAWLNGIVDATTSIAIGPFTTTAEDTGYPVTQAKNSTYYTPFYIDELRIYNGLPSADWIKLDYETQRDNLINYGREIPIIKMTKKQELYLDLGDVEFKNNIVLHVGSGTKYGTPLLSPGGSGDGDAEAVYGGHVFITVDGYYRCYYQGERSATDSCYRLMYAESLDGITWIKPNLKTVGDYKGITRTTDIIHNSDGGNNNIVFDRGSPNGGSPEYDGQVDSSIIYDANATNTGTDGKFKGMYTTYDANCSSGKFHRFNFYYSYDGINWTPYASNPVIESIQTYSAYPGTLEATGFDTSCLVHDPSDTGKEYKLYFQTVEDDGYYANSGLRRAGIMYSSDCINWTRDTLSPNMDPSTFDLDGESQYHLFYINRIGNNHYFGMLQIMNSTTNRADVAMCTSRNGKGDSWIKISTGAQSAERLIPLGVYHTDWDGGMIYATARHLVVGNQWRLYYTADYEDNTVAIGPSKVGLITFRKDGYTYVQGTVTGAYLISYLYDYTALSGRLFKININPNGQSPTVELLNSSDSVITGYAKTDCNALIDDINQTVTWAGSSTLPSQDFKIKIYLENGAKLYAYFLGDTAYTDINIETKYPAFYSPWAWWKRGKG